MLEGIRFHRKDKIPIFLLAQKSWIKANYPRYCKVICTAFSRILVSVNYRNGRICPAGGKPGVCHPVWQLLGPCATTPAQEAPPWGNFFSGLQVRGWETSWNVGELLFHDLYSSVPKWYREAKSFKGSLTFAWIASPVYWHAFPLASLQWVPNSLLTQLSPSFHKDVCRSALLPFPYAVIFLPKALCLSLFSFNCPYIAILALQLLLWIRSLYVKEHETAW